MSWSRGLTVGGLASYVLSSPNLLPTFPARRGSCCLDLFSTSLARRSSCKAFIPDCLEVFTGAGEKGGRRSARRSLLRLDYQLSRNICLQSLVCRVVKNRQTSAAMAVTDATAALPAGPPAMKDHSKAAPPRAKKVEHKFEPMFGEVREDPYYWLRDDKRENPEVLEHIAAENAYTEAMMADTAQLQEQLYKEMRGRIKEADESVPLRDGPYWYYRRTEEGKQYSVRCRRSIPGGEGPGSLEEAMDANSAEEVLLDENERSTHSEFYKVGGFQTSPDHQLLAYGEDTVGGEKYSVHVRRLDTGEELLPKPVEGTSGSLAWANDNTTLFYVTKDELDRPYKVWKHKLGSDPAEDECVYHEADEAFYVGMGRSDSEKYIFLACGSAITSDVKALDADRPEEGFKELAPRVQNEEVEVTHSGDFFFITKRSEELYNSELLIAPVDSPLATKTLLPHRPEVKLDRVEAFERHLALFERDCRTGLQSITVYDLTATVESEGCLPEGRRIEFPEETSYSLEPEASQFKSHILRFGFTSLKTPHSTIDYDMDSGGRKVKKVAPVLGGFDPSKYQTDRRWATSHDGTKVPISLVWRRTSDGSESATSAASPAPLLLTGYGSYEVPNDPYFSANRLSLIDRGVVFAVAHTRGGGDLGRKWYENGKYLHKKNTFLDFVACAEELVEQGVTTPDQLAIEGRSAGGLLIGATVNLRPDLFKAAIAGVPFVDVLTTMLDSSIPLTTLEWEEWGNPRNEEYYWYMKSYSPINNVRKGTRYPNLLVTGGLHDPRVAYWEPTKWVARLREAKEDDNLLLLKVDMGAGHFSKSGRFDRLKEVGFEYAFLLKCFGLASDDRREDTREAKL